MHWIDHHFLPDIAGMVQRFIANANGEIDGLMLTYDPGKLLFVHVPPHLTTDIEAAIEIGDPIRLRGIRPRSADMVAAVALIASDGNLVLDIGPDRQRAVPPVKSQSAKIHGMVQRPLYGPHGELRGAILEDGTVIRVKPKKATAVAALLQSGAAIVVHGEGFETRHGLVVAVSELKPARPHHTASGHETLARVEATGT